MGLPITLIFDDPAPLINVNWWHAGEAHEIDHPVLPSGEPVVRDVPVDFLRAFVDLISRWDTRINFLVLPYPVGLGEISADWESCDTHALNTWLDLVRTHVTPRMDITPENLIHSRTPDLDTLSPLPQNERDWAQHQTGATLPPYIGYALEILIEVDLDATGVTSPWNFDIQDEVCCRIHSTWNTKVQWITCSALATQIAAGEL